MPSPLPEYADVIRGQIMHDIGVWASEHSSAPSLAVARRLAAVRAARDMLTGDIVEDAARQALRDWRATQRVRSAEPDTVISRGYVSGRQTSGEIGVRIQLDLAYDGPKPPGARNTATVLVNVTPGTTIEAAVNAAIASWGTAQLQTMHGGRSGGRAVAGRVVQVIEYGFPQAQITVG